MSDDCELDVGDRFFGAMVGVKIANIRIIRTKPKAYV
jgi:hypothetical protein